MPRRQIFLTSLVWHKSKRGESKRRKMNLYLAQLRRTARNRRDKMLTRSIRRHDDKGTTKETSDRRSPRSSVDQTAERARGASKPICMEITAEIDKTDRDRDWVAIAQEYRFRA